jgi:hypothetical protein
MILGRVLWSGGLARQIFFFHPRVGQIVDDETSIRLYEGIISVVTLANLMLVLSYLSADMQILFPSPFSVELNPYDRAIQVCD